jgi:hypothetical protein
MSNNLKMRDVIEASLPEGSIWKVAPEGDLAKFIDGLGENAQAVYDFLELLAHVRDPRKSQIIEDLVREFGMTGLIGVGTSEELIRQYTAAVKYAPAGSGSESYLEQRLHELGFPQLFVYQNDPAIDPRPFIDTEYVMTAGDDDAYAGDDDAYAGYSAGFGELLVNGDIFTYEKAIESQANGIATFAGNQLAISGYFTRMKKTLLEYIVPSDPNYWRFIFFVGGIRGGCNYITDGDMESATTTAWTAGPNTTLAKDLTIKNTGFRSLKITASLPIGSNQELSPLDIDASRIVHYRMYDAGNTFIRDNEYTYPARSVGAPANTESLRGRAINFAGSDWLQCYDLGATLTTDFTFSAIITTTGSIVFDQTIIGRVGLIFLQWLFGVNWVTGYLYFQDAGGGVTVASSLGIVTDGVPHLVGFTISSTGNMKMFKDGVFSGSVAITTGTVANNTNIGGYNDGSTSDWFFGDIYEPKMYTEEKNSTWLSNEYAKFQEEKILDYRTYAPSSQLRDVTFDGDFEHISLYWWTSVGSANLTKTAGPNKELVITYNGAAPYGASQSVLQPFTEVPVLKYRIVGQARGDGTAAPQVQLGTTVAWTGTSSTSLQPFDVESTFSSALLRLMSTGGAGTSVQFESIAVYPVEGTTGQEITQAIDVTGGYNGDAFNCVDVCTPYGPGLLFNGVNSMLNDESCGRNFTDGFTLTAWIKTDTIGTSKREIITRAGILNDSFRFGMSDGKLTFRADSIYTGSGDVNDDVWHFVAVVINGSSSKFFIDGVQDGSTFNPTITTYNVPLKIGARKSATDVFNGIIVSPKVYGDVKDSTWMAAQYSAGQALALIGAYAEQILGDAIPALSDISGFAWGDGAGGIPVFMGRSTPGGDWIPLWCGEDSTAKQPFTVQSDEDIDAIRLYVKFATSGIVNFDDIFAECVGGDISIAQVPIELKEVLHRVILKYKPIRSWAALLVEYI